MWKQFVALARGRTFEAGEGIVDRNALTILRQQLRDCAAAIAAARKAIAFATAQNAEEIAQHRRLVARVEDLETRALAALEQGKEALAREAAETIGLLEAERETSEQAQASFGAEIARLRRVVATSELRLRELQRGQRLATAVDTTQKLRATAPGSALSTLRDAEETLARLRLRQGQIDAAANALEAMEESGDATALAERMAAAGCGAPIRTSADAVLERLKQKRGAQA